MFEAYFDETGSHDNAAVLSVAGFIFESDKASDMRKRWQAVLDANEMPFLHMSDFAAGGGPYQHLSLERRQTIQRELHAILYDTAMCGIAISVSKEAFLRSGLSTSALPSPYMLCCFLCLFGVCEALGERRLQGELRYFFEEGDRHQKSCDQTMAFLFRDLDKVSHAFVPKTHGGPIQAADMFAWLHNKYVRSLLAGEDKMRADLKSLVTKVRCDASCLTTTDRIYALFERMGVRLPGSTRIQISGTCFGMAFGRPTPDEPPRRFWW